MLAKFLAIYLVTLIAFAIIDSIWLMGIAKSYYRSELSGLLADKFNIPAAIAFYLIYSAGIVIFAIAPHSTPGSWQTAALYGALFGFFCYATYDLTNLATLKGWPLGVSLVDMAWGAALTSVVAVIGREAAVRLG
jgi:uncharacterized membrane protein